MRVTAAAIAAFGVAALTIGLVAGPAVADGLSGTDPDLPQRLCRMVDDAAAANRLPAAFLTRVLWQESRFRSEATSRAGAEGVAQFMPRTAAERGLANPREPAQAIAEAARLLADLAARFGNLGLAAAAYNAGAGRVGKWLQAQSSLPGETRLYVTAVTGRPADDWARAAGAARDEVIDGGPCLAALTEIARHAPVRIVLAARQVQLDRTLEAAVRLLSSLPEARRTVAPASVRAANGLCDMVRSLGARCAVYQP
jgi:transglycosylase-like protein with SLT domain